MFQKIVATVAIVILIIALCFIGIALYRQTTSSNYPPVIANCPDYWDVSGNLCINSMDLGKAKCTAPSNVCKGSKCMDFSTPQWNNTSSMCQKYKWAQGCDLTWDGITDNASLCG
jgi:hypothetical protein